MKRLSALLLLFVAFAATAFSQNNQVVFSFDHKVGSDPLVLNETVFSIWNNKKIKLTRAEFYISEVEIHHPDSMVMPLTDQYLLVNAKNPTAEFDLGAWPVEAAHGVTLHLGVPQAVNHLDPASYPANHPLAPQNPSMQWGWTAGYRFMAIEGKVDNNGDGIPETSFEFHNLGDALYKTLDLTGMEEASNGVLHLHFVLDYAQLFKNMAMTGNLIQHGSAAPNVNMMNNAATQNFVVLPMVSATHEVEANSLNIKASPNPANVETMIEYTLPASSGLALILTNTLGQTVRSLTGLTANGSVRLETATLPEGIYQYAFYENGNLLARKQLVVKH
ncbi:MAG: T9SS type A sorting domain-containing protein [Chitinophagales bacterium]|nr:T9SS type A sorting domain-containing protein [Chitinophagales bacterium]MDX1913237.1 MbnP family protein [Saprospiraceae bacterium]